MTLEAFFIVASSGAMDEPKEIKARNLGPHLTVLGELAYSMYRFVLLSKKEFLL